jgi:long-chain acyl-CoA synthetase
MEVGGIAGSKAIFRDVEHRIEDVPEMGYTSQDKPYPRGELVVKAKGMALGYFKNEEETQKAFKDGWYYTGDIVAVEKNGYVRVIDRKKDIFKLAQGEFVSPVRCEAVFHQSKFVEQICVYGDSLKNYLVAVIVPNEGVLTRWAAEENLSANCFEELCALPEVNDLILKDMEACALLNKVRISHTCN